MVVVRVQDSCGNFTDYSYSTRVDNTPPTIICPVGPILASADTFTATLCGGTVSYMVDALDNCGSPVVTCQTCPVG